MNTLNKAGQHVLMLRSCSEQLRGFIVYNRVSVTDITLKDELYLMASKVTKNVPSTGVSD